MNAATNAEQRLAARVAAAELRALAHALVSHSPDTDLLAELTASARTFTERVTKAPPHVRDVEQVRAGVLEGRLGPDGQLVHHHDTCTVCGPANPFGLATTMFPDGSGVSCTLTFGPGFEGAPGRPHGGSGVAAVFDDVMGHCTTLHGEPAFTGELTVRYVAPIPVDQPVRFVARVTRRERRKRFIEAEAYSIDGTMLAWARAIFIVIPGFEKN